MRRLGIIPVLLFVTGCSVESAPFDKNDSAGLPRLKLVATLSGQVAQVGAKGEVIYRDKPLVQYSPPNDSRRVIPFEPGVPDESRKIWFDNSEKPIAIDAFLDQDSHIQRDLGHDSFIETVGGKEVRMLPLDTKTADYRYYAGDGKLYARKRTENVFKELCSIPQESRLVSQDGTIFVPELKDEYTIGGTFVSAALQPKHVEIPKSALVFDIGSSGALLLSRSTNFFLRNGSKELLLKHASNCHLWENGNKTYIFGVARIRPEDGPKAREIPCIWNDKGEPVPLYKLCPELESAIYEMREDFHHFAFCSNRNGTIAVGIYGNFVDPAKKREPDTYQNWKRECRTFVLKVQP